MSNIIHEPMAKMTEASDILAKPHQLCDKCRTFARGLQEYADMIVAHGARTPQKTHLHHQNIDQMIDSGLNGCHLCMMLSFAWTQAETDHGIPIKQETVDRLEVGLKWRFSGSETSWCTPFVLQVSRNPVNHLTVHRHQNTANTMKDCASISVREDNHPGGSAVRWSLSTGSMATCFLVKKWLHSCRSNHPQCKSEPFSPTRLLDIDPFPDSADIRIVSGEGILEYATLSYCWGDVKSIMLQRDNYNELHTRIKWKRLPRTMQDAVIVSRRLKVRYLWIDALCIVQGEDGDFRTEALRMQSVYSGSLVTIAAADAENPSQGCFRECTPLKYRECVIHENENESIFVDANQFFENSPQRKHLETCVLNKRGWVFQERILSPRTIHFAKDKVYWECRRGMLCDLQPSFNPSDYLHMSKALFETLTSLDNKSLSRSISIFQRLWWDILGKYTTTSLTYEKDRLSAIAGIISYPQNLLSMEASFGIWKEFLLDGLCWYTWQRTELTAKSCFPHIPTWSWLQLRNVHIDNPRRDSQQYIRENLFSAAITRLPASTPFTQLPDLSRYNSTLGVAAPYVRCRAQSYLNSQGKWAWMVFPVHEHQPFELQDHQILDLLKPRPSNPGAVFSASINQGRNFFPDFPGEMLSCTDLYCLQLKRDVYIDPLWWLHVWDFGLVLEQIQGATGEYYKRIGLYCEDSGADIEPYTFHESEHYLFENNVKRGEIVRSLEERMTMFPKTESLAGLDYDVVRDRQWEEIQIR